jgi:integrase
MVLSVRQIEAAKPKEKGYKLADAHGLYLYITPAGGKSWRANYAQQGKQKTRTYGMYPAVSLALARALHQAPRSDEHSFEAVAQEWLKIKLPTLSNGKHQAQVQATLERFAFPAIGSVPVAQLKRADLVKVVKAVAGRGTHETAHRLAGRIGMVLNYAQDCGYLESHPGAGLTRVLEAVKTVPMACVPVNEAHDLLKAIAGYGEPVTRLALLTLAHTFVRDNELRGMTAGEIKRDEMLWVIPAERMKKRRPHVVPLTTQSLALIDKALSYSTSSFVFESIMRPGKPIGENTLLFALYRLGYRGRMTAHGFRSLASTVLNEQTKFSPDAIERQLSHEPKDETRAAYNRAAYLDERRQIMAWWSDWLQKE